MDTPTAPTPRLWAGDRLRGLVTDRDLVVRALADDRPATTSVQEICSANPVTCAPATT